MKTIKLIMLAVALCTSSAWATDYKAEIDLYILDPCLSVQSVYSKDEGIWEVSLPGELATLKILMGEIEGEFDEMYKSSISAVRQLSNLNERKTIYGSLLKSCLEGAKLF